jgi:type II secretory pathway pseudopilin PulG
LIELLVVVAVIVIMTGLAVPAFNAIRGGTDFASEVYNMTGTLDQARAYAVANNTYVLAGIAEVSAGQDTAASPQVSGTGRIAMAIVAAKNGTRPYQSLFPNGLANWSSIYTTGTNGLALFVPVSTLMTFQNIHLVDLQPSTGASGGMIRPVVTPSYYDLPSTSGSSSTTFSWPLGASASAARYTFKKVIEFDPQGSARIISSSNPASYPPAVPLYMEIGLEACHGTVANNPPAGQPPTAGQIAAIQVVGITGATHIYRP